MLLGGSNSRRALLWLLLAVALWLSASLTAPRTPVEIISNGRGLKLDVAGSSLGAQVAIESVERIEIWAMDSVYPPGGRSIEVVEGKRTVLIDRLPRRFDIPRGRIVPLGDWELDELAGAGTVYSHELELEGSFVVRANFTGRVHHHLVIALIGTPTVELSFRRGLINNDLFIFEESGAVVASTTIDPEPVRDLLAAYSNVARAAAGAALLIAGFLIVAAYGSTPDRRAGPRSAAGGAAMWATAALLVLIAGGISLWVADQVLERMPHFPDSVVYLLQAQWLLGGEIFQSASEIQDHLSVPYTYLTDGRWVAHYPFGWPALLALGLAADSPWIVAPLLGALYTALLFLIGRELYGPSVGLAAVVLCVVSPVACLLFASMLSHAASSCLILLFLWLLLVARRTGSAWPALAAGLALGLAFGIRPLTAVAIAIPCGVLLLIDLGTGRQIGRGAVVLAATTLGGLAGTVPALVVNLVVTGNPVAFPYTLASGHMYAPQNLAIGIRNFDTILAFTVPNLYGWGWGFAQGWIFLALPLAFALVPFLLRRQNSYDLLLAASFVSVVICHLLMYGHGLHGYGPRYYFDAFFALYLLTARGFQELARIGAGPDDEVAGFGLRSASGLLSVALFTALNVSAAVVLPERLSLFRGYNRVDRSLIREIERQNVDHAVVAFGDQDWRDWARAAPIMAGEGGRDVVFARLLADNSALVECHADRQWYLWQEGTLEPMKPEEIASRSARE
jgi:hypothetical protein